MLKFELCQFVIYLFKKTIMNNYDKANEKVKKMISDLEMEKKREALRIRLSGTSAGRDLLKYDEYGI